MLCLEHHLTTHTVSLFLTQRIYSNKPVDSLHLCEEVEAEVEQSPRGEL